MSTYNKLWHNYTPPVQQTDHMSQAVWSLAYHKGRVPKFATQSDEFVTMFDADHIQWLAGASARCLESMKSGKPFREVGPPTLGDPSARPLLFIKDPGVAALQSGDNRVIYLAAAGLDYVADVMKEFKIEPEVTS